MSGILGYGAMQLTSMPGICSGCHEIYPAVESWKQSIHSGITCRNCHVPPGIMGGMGRIYLQLTVFNKPSNQPRAQVKEKMFVNNVCGRCHSSNRAMAFSGGLNVPHIKHIEKGFMCTTCHSKVVHGEGGEKTRKPEMETCMRCHDGETAPEACGVCHITAPEPTSEDHPPSDY